MAVVFPNAAIARRWDGALRARLRRAPLEEFIRARGITPASPGVSQDSDDVTHATVLIVQSGIALYFRERDDGLDVPQRAIVGQVACVVSRAIAETILQPGAWRIAALVSTTRLLSPWIGLNAAALASASSVRAYERDFWKPVLPMAAVSAALTAGSVAVMAELSTGIALRLSWRGGRELDSCEDFKDFQSGS